MALHEILNQPPQDRLLPRMCAVKKILITVEDKDRQALENAIGSIREAMGSGDITLRKTVNTRWLHEALTSEGHEISFDTVSKHIRFRCGCRF